MKLFLTAAITLAATLAAQAQSNTWFTGSNNQTQTIDLTTFGSNSTLNPFSSSLNSGNTNPSYRYQNSYTRRDGTVVRGQTIYQGSRGGQYYINRNGNRTYVPKRR